MTRIPLVLAVSCAAAGCAPDAPPSVASAPPAAGPWQQVCEQAWSVPHASALVSARGVDGWELVAMYNGVLCYKRPMPDAVRDAARAPALGRPAAGPTTPVPIMRDPGFLDRGAA